MSLPKYELTVYFILWIICFISCFYKVYHHGGELFRQGLLGRNDLIDGWHIFGRSKDVSDSDWFLWTAFIYKLFPWIFLHLISCQLIRFLIVEAIPLCHVFITGLVLHFNFPEITLVVLIIQFCLFYAVTIIGSRILVWSLGICFLVLINSIPTLFKRYYGTHYEEITLTSICLGWFLVRCIDFALSELQREHYSHTKRFIDFIGYAFYLPCFFLGPFIPYDHFINKVYSNYESWTWSRFKFLIFDISKYYFWYTVYEIASHYFYCHSMHYSPEVLIPLGIWTLSGVGLCMAQFFFVKYVVIYGTSITIAKAEGYPVPAHPKCVNRIHLYSDMWRNFDRGFYLFIFRCIYQPICGSSNPKLSTKLYASFLCFCFVFVWHGVNLTVFLWCLLNFLGLTVEALWNVTKKSQFHKSMKNYIGKNNIKRCHAIVVSPLWIMAIISNFIFFGGHNLGIIYVQEIVKGGWIAISILLTTAYCMSQISMETNRLLESKSRYIGIIKNK